MDRVQAEENIKVIRNIMERSGRYTIFSGWSGIIAGMMALIGCVLTAQVWISVPTVDQNPWYLAIWLSVLILSILQDRFLAERKAKQSGQTTWMPITYQAIYALLPGVFLAFVLSLRALSLYEYDAIPSLWTLGYGAALCGAGMYSIRELRIFGVIQLITGGIGLFLPDIPVINDLVIRGVQGMAKSFGASVTHDLAISLSSLCLVALSFGVYHIIYGLLIMRKYGR